MIINALNVTCSVKANVITDANIGPTQGVQRSPKDSPIRIPGVNPGRKLLFGTNLESLANITSSKVWNFGTKKEIPKNKITITEKNLNESADILIILIIVERKSVKKVKLKTKPTTIPIGRPFPVSLSPIDEDKMIGNIGKIQGDKTVTIPARNEKIIRKIILYFQVILQSAPHSIFRLSHHFHQSEQMCVGT